MKLVSVFKFKHNLTDELGVQLVKNSTYLLKQIIESGGDHSLNKIFNKCSVIARKVMLNVT